MPTADELQLQATMKKKLCTNKPLSFRPTFNFFWNQTKKSPSALNLKQLKNHGMDHKPYEGQVPIPELWQGIRPLMIQLPSERFPVCVEKVGPVFPSVVSKMPSWKLPFFFSKIHCFVWKMCVVFSWLYVFFRENPLIEIRMIAKKGFFSAPFLPNSAWQKVIFCTDFTIKLLATTWLCQHQSYIQEKPIFLPYLM